ncbi:MAG: superinfection immunity protein [Burkholderiales bacterium]|nr:superinfection immunity protein [Burkholderiales bacterium]
MNNSGIKQYHYYFLPSIIANLRNHKNTTAIFVLNLLLGWSLLGWIICLVWSFTN